MRDLITNKINRRKLIKIIAFSAIGSTTYGIYNLFGNKEYIKSRWTGTVLNNNVSLEIHSNEGKKNSLIYSQINNFINHVDDIFNLQNPDSEIVKLNKNKKLRNPSPYLIEVIKRSQILSEQTNGKFDITVQPLWSHYYNHFILNGNSNFPDDKILKNIINSIHWKNVVIENNTIILKNNASITLNGIAQGWITDKVVEIINKNNIKNTLVDFGETFASGSYENKRPWNIEIQSSEGINTVIKLTNKAVATSSASGTMFEPSKKYNHIFNPKTGLSTSNFDTVSIVSNKAWLSDCIATSALLISRNRLKALCDKLNAKAFISEKNNFKELV